MQPGEVGAIRARGVLLVALACVAVAGSAAAAPRASFTATPLQGATCVAPCAFHFDAIGNGSNQTTDTAFPRAFHSLIFHWDFGDPGSGTWAVNGSSRDIAIGAIAGHLYEDPGTYLVRLTTTNPHGETDVAEAQVIVADPNSVFGSSNTWCFANSGTPGGAGFEECPTTNPARHVVIPSTAAGGFDLALSSDYCRVSFAKTRCLFRAGDRFLASAVATLSSTAGPGLLSRFGSGADPRIEGGGGFLFLRSGWTVAGFDVALAATGTAYPLFRVIQQEGHITVANVRGRNLRSVCLETETGAAPQHSDLIGLFGVDCLNIPSDGLAGLYLRAERVLVMGNTIDNAYQGQFVLRTVHFPHSVVAHNRLLRPHDDPANPRNTIQLRAWAGNGGPAPPQPTPSATSYVLVADNVIGQDNASVFIRTCQTNDCTDSPYAQEMSNLIFERNFLFFTSHPGGTPSRMARAFWIQGGDVTVRDNIVDLQGIESGSFPEQDRLVDQQPNMASTPGLDDDRIQVFNNVVYFKESVSRTYRICSSLAAGGGHRCQNNLLYLPNHTGPKLSDDGPEWTSSSNVFAASNPFVAPIPAQGTSVATDFQLAPTASAEVDAGYDFGVEDAGTRLDFATRCRPADGNADAKPGYDIGAWERASTAACMPAPEPGAALAGSTALLSLSLALRLCQSPRRARSR